MEAIQYLNVSNKSLLILLLSNLVRPSHSGQLSLLPSARWETVTRQETVAVIRGWEGNRRYSFAPVMRHRPRGISPTGARTSQQGGLFTAYTQV